MVQNLEIEMKKATAPITIQRAFGSHTNTQNLATEPGAVKNVAAMELKQHPLSAAWPPMPDDEFQLLVDSIEDLGVLNPITIADGMVLDGWNRYRAAMQLGMPCPQADFDESMDIKQFVDAQNGSRRNITKSQRAAVVVAMHGYIRPNRPKNNQVPGTYLPTVAALAAEAGVGDKTIKDAIAADKAGLLDEVRTGKMTAKAAAKKARASKPKKDKPKKDKPAAKPAKAESAPPEHADEPPEDYGPTADELRAGELAFKADMDAFQMILDSDDKLATAHAEIKRLNAEVACLKVARDGYMNQTVELIRRVKALQRKESRNEH